MRRFPSLLLTTILASGTLFAISAHRDAVEVKASGPTAHSGNLPSSLTLNDTSEANVRSYYASLNSLPESERRGTNLLKNLRPILQDFEYYTYQAIWKIYEITDREWALSPEEEITQGTYDATTRTVTKYKYGSGTSSPGSDNPFVHTLYRNRDENGVTIESGRIREWGPHTQTGGTNREHVWCQSRGFPAYSSSEAEAQGTSDTNPQGPAGTDLHHLISGDGYVNGKPHNNNPYGFVDWIKTDASVSYAYCAGNYEGTPVNGTAGDDSDYVFEPQDSDKGDIARACFYMAACYNNVSGNEDITRFNPNLIMCDYATSSGVSEVSSATKPVGMGILRDLLAWHKLDPVDDYEIHRNNLIYENYQHNRNPFIDFPEWVDAIWGTTELNPSTKKVSYDPTPVGVASPATDDVRTYGEKKIVSIAASNMKTSFEVGDAFSFGGTVIATYDDDSQEDVTTSCSFSGYDLSVEGNQTVTVTYSTVTTTYDITVTAAASSSSSSSEPDPAYDYAYTAVTDIGELRDGDKIVLAAKETVDKEDRYYAMSATQNTNNRAHVELNDCDGEHIGDLGSGIAEFTLVKVPKTSYWAFYDSVNDGYLYAASSSGNQLKTQTVLDANGNFRLTYDGGWKIVAQGENSRNHLRHNQTSSIFSCYAEGSSIKTLPIIFKSYASEADVYGKAFLETYTAGCDQYGGESTLDWSGASNAYDALSKGAKELLSTISSTGGSEYRFQAVARYDYVVGKYGTSTYADFMGRNPAYIGASFAHSSSASSSEALIVMTLLLLGAGGVGFILLRRGKRKEIR